LVSGRIHMAQGGLERQSRKRLQAARQGIEAHRGTHTGCTSWGIVMQGEEPRQAETGTRAEGGFNVVARVRRERDRAIVPGSGWGTTNVMGSRRGGLLEGSGQAGEIGNVQDGSKLGGSEGVTCLTGSTTQDSPHRHTRDISGLLLGRSGLGLKHTSSSCAPSHVMTCIHNVIRPIWNNQAATCSFARNDGTANLAFET